MAERLGVDFLRRLNGNEALLAGPLFKVAEQSVPGHLTLVNDNDAVASHLHLGQDVCGKQDGMLLAQFANELARLPDLGRVQADRRLIQNEHGRLGQQSIR